jgi:nucleoside-diphosphate-sugar epimerase
MNILITGAAGFIGFKLAKTLVEKGHRVRGLLMPQENDAALIDVGVEIYRGDLTRPDSLVGVAADMDIVYHLAARTLDWGTRKQFETVMVDGTNNLLEESQGHVSRFVYCSSFACMGLGRDLSGLNEDDERKICGIPYCDTKIIAEDLVADFCRRNSLDYTIIRPANVFGPGSVWVKEVLDAFRRGPVPLINKGSAPSAFIYIDNLVDGIMLAGFSDIAKGKTYFFGDDYPLTWAEYLKTVGSWIGKAPIGSMPFWLAWALGAMFETLLVPFGIRPPMTRLAAGVMGKDLSVDSSRARQELGWESRISQDTAMEKIKEWVDTCYLTSTRDDITHKTRKRHKND